MLKSKHFLETWCLNMQSVFSLRRFDVNVGKVSGNWHGLMAISKRHCSYICLTHAAHCGVCVLYSMICGWSPGISRLGCPGICASLAEDEADMAADQG